MNGFWDGVFTFVQLPDTVLLLPTILLIIAYLILKPESNSILSATVLLLLSIVFQFLGARLYSKVEKSWGIININVETQTAYIPYNPFSDAWGWTSIDYAKQTSVIHGLIKDVRDLVKIPFDKSREVTLSSAERQLVQPLFNANPVSAQNIPTGNLYIILFESFEIWSITPLVTPAIYDFIQSHNNVLWAKKITKQTKGGTSSDGQMIVNTGILPALRGATCFRFPGNCYPSLSEIYEKTALIQPGNMGIWNQKRMSDAYHIANNFVISDSNDAETFSKLMDIYREYQYVMAISMASHTPFASCPDHLKMSWNESMPEIMKNYLNCVHFTDACLKEFLERVDTDEILSNSTIIITGDHTIFEDGLRKKFNEYCVSSGEDYRVMEAYCPLIVYSPVIKEKTIIDTIAYQMDVFPTALYSIGCDSTYYWKGFGVNLLDGRKERNLTDEQASIISDKMIQADYWKEMKRY